MTDDCDKRESLVEQEFKKQKLHPCAGTCVPPHVKHEAGGSGGA